MTMGTAAWTAMNQLTENFLTPSRQKPKGILMTNVMSARIGMVVFILLSQFPFALAKNVSLILHRYVKLHWHSVNNIYLQYNR